MVTEGTSGGADPETSGGRVRRGRQDREAHVGLSPVAVCGQGDSFRASPGRGCLWSAVYVCANGAPSVAPSLFVPPGPCRCRGATCVPSCYFIAAVAMACD
ncbi:hypothetical protein E2C01_019740 [Portunus trituberculatus]|uniref:Uncharacterized protein n=1 Tax=Portunus trituberculatus TaxID=210409 RepID=A0A5B7DZT4_PORTR|nr:hypothetical protein [Portunus trituberculatus]